MLSYQLKFKRIETKVEPVKSTVAKSRVWGLLNREM